jgi:hypothetical protein
MLVVLFYTLVAIFKFVARFSVIVGTQNGPVFDFESHGVQQTRVQVFGCVREHEQGNWLVVFNIKVAFELETVAKCSREQDDVAKGRLDGEFAKLGVLLLRPALSWKVQKEVADFEKEIVFGDYRIDLVRRKLESSGKIGSTGRTCNEAHQHGHHLETGVPSPREIRPGGSDSRR